MDLRSNPSPKANYMGDIKIQKSLSFLAGKTPLQTNGAIAQKIFELPNKAYAIEDFNEGTAHHFKVVDGAVDQSLCQGTVATGEVFVLLPEADLELKIVNAAGTSQALIVRGGMPSIMYVDFTDLLVSNSSGDDVKGMLFVAGEE